MLGLRFMVKVALRARRARPFLLFALGVSTLALLLPEAAEEGRSLPSSEDELESPVFSFLSAAGEKI
jgi:hypothetical protein